MTGRPVAAPLTGARPLPERTVLADGVYASVRRLIMNHAIAPGERVGIDALARELAVSPTPLREALARLESEGLVVKQPLRGYRTTPLLSREDLRALYQLRLLIEPWAAATAADRVRAGDVGAERVADLRTELATAGDRVADPGAGTAGPAGAAATAPGGTPPDAASLALAAHDARFHDLVAQLSGNEPVRLALERTHCHLHVFRLYYESGMRTPTVEEHAAVVRAIAAGRADRADRAMRRHLERSLRRLVPVARST